MTKVKAITAYLESKYPLYLASSFDQGKVGLQFGNLDKEVKTIMIALDGTTKVIEDAIIKKVDLLITHHPFMFNPLLKMDYNNPLQKRIKLVIQNELNVFSMHTNFDVSNEGMNDILANLLDFKNIVTENNEIDVNSFIRVGQIAPCTFKQFAHKVKDIFHEESIKVIGDFNKVIKRVGIVGGGGAFAITKAKQLGCDCYITGEIHHNNALDAIDLDLNVIEVSHSIESNFKYQIKTNLEELFPEISIIYSEYDVDPFKTIK